MTMGSDFQYENAVMWFKNLDKLIKYVNAAVRRCGCRFDQLDLELDSWLMLCFCSDPLQFSSCRMFLI